MNFMKNFKDKTEPKPQTNVISFEVSDTDMALLTEMSQAHDMPIEQIAYYGTLNKVEQLSESLKPKDFAEYEAKVKALGQQIYDIFDSHDSNLGFITNPRSTLENYRKTTEAVEPLLTEMEHLINTPGDYFSLTAHTVELFYVLIMHSNYANYLTSEQTCFFEALRSEVK